LLGVINCIYFRDKNQTLISIGIIINYVPQLLDKIISCYNTFKQNK
jgi:hypothetical protein